MGNPLTWFLDLFTVEGPDDIDIVPEEYAPEVVVHTTGGAVVSVTYDEFEARMYEVIDQLNSEHYEQHPEA